MDFETTFPLRVYLNTATADQERQRLEAHFYERGLEVRRQPAISGAWLAGGRHYGSQWERALAMSLRLALRRAMVARVPAVFIFFEDVVLHPAWRERLSKAALPADWGLFLAGCVHEEPPVPCGAGLVRCVQADGVFALGVHSGWFTKLRRALRGSECSGRSVRKMLMDWQREVPCCAAWPNLAWRESEDFHADGSQRRAAEKVAGLRDASRHVASAEGSGWRPLMHPREVDAIATRLEPGMTMLEYGSGGSTLHFSRMVARYYSVEHLADWHKRVQPEAERAGAVVVLRPPAWPQTDPYAAALPGQFTDYFNAWRDFAEMFDAVLIDGRARVEAALSAAEGVKPGGWLFFHDYFSRDRYWRRQAELERCYTLVEAVRDTEQTLAIFRRR